MTVYTVQHVSGYTRNFRTPRDAHGKLAAIATAFELDLKVHSNKTPWPDSARSVAYLRGGDPLLDCQAYVWRRGVPSIGYGEVWGLTEPIGPGVHFAKIG